MHLVIILPDLAADFKTIPVVMTYKITSLNRDFTDVGNFTLSKHTLKSAMFFISNFIMLSSSPKPTFRT
jgi:hypothetical protein